MGKSLVLGFFDGVHKAHRAVIESALKHSDDTAVITFKESPAVYFSGKTEYILSRKNSIKKIKELGVKEVVELDFSKIAKVSAKEYLEFLVNTYHPISISTGYNHTFGFNKTGNTKFLFDNQHQYNYIYECVTQVIDDGKLISSTLIKEYLNKGNIEKANFLLESNFILEGVVVHGAKIGRTIGFPTANINYPKEIVKIPFGVYSVSIYTDDNEKHIGIMNWGMKPTVNNTIEPVVEVHILNFDKDLYDKNIRIEVLNQIRGERKFGSLDELKAQIQEDIKKCSKL